MRHLARALAVLAVAAPAAAAPPPALTNAKLETRSAAAGLAAAARSAVAASAAGPVTWIGWSVPTSGDGTSCCWFDDASSRRCRGCRLEGRDDWDGSGDDRALEALEPTGRLSVLVRAESGRVGRVRSYSEECPLDAGRRAVVWLEDVGPAESVAWLEALLDPPADGVAGAKRLDDGVLAAIALHADPSAAAALVRVAKRHPDGRVRGQALFWLAQTAAKRAPAAIREAIDDDPEVEVKKKAVFALSQLPKDESVPLLIGLAKSHKSYEVRKQAMFWLGQSHDARALAFFEDVLAN